MPKYHTLKQAVASMSSASVSAPSLGTSKSKMPSSATSFTPDTAKIKATGDEMLLPYVQSSHGAMLSATGSSSLQSPQRRASGSPM